MLIEGQRKVPMNHWVFIELDCVVLSKIYCGLSGLLFLALV